MTTASKLPQLDFAKLEREITSPPPVNFVDRKAKTAVQIIAHGITQLRWRDAESMGESVKAKMKDGNNLTAAIQAWAEEWESF